MINVPFFKSPSGGSLGIDIGTHSIKIVELSGGINNIILENYGEVFLRDFVGKNPVKGTSGTFLYSSSEIAEALKYLLTEMGVKGKRAYFVLPDFVSFFTSFALPSMKKEEISSAVEFHSRQYIPLPISEVALDWFTDGEAEGKEIKINLVAVPNEVIDQYQEIATLSGMDIISLESEVFALVRALTKEEDGLVAIADIGEQSTLLAIGERGKLKTTHSLEIAGNMLIEQVAKSVDIEYNEARKLIMTYGVAEEGIRRIVSSLATSLFLEISRVVNTFEKKENKKIKEIIMVGGFSLLPGVLGYAKEQIDKKVVVKNCFDTVKYPESLREELMQISPSHVIALGAALIDIEKETEEK